VTLSVPLIIAVLIVAWLTAGGMVIRSVSRIWLRLWAERQLRGAAAAVTYLAQARSCASEQADRSRHRCFLGRVWSLGNSLGFYTVKEGHTRALNRLALQGGRSSLGTPRRWNGADAAGLLHCGHTRESARGGTQAEFS
jgi:hypothetical protein